MRTILFNTPMTINSIYQSASVIEFQEHYNSSNKTLVRIDVEPFAPRITAATNGTEYMAITISRDGTVWATTTAGTRVPLTKTPYSAPESATLTQVGEMWVGSHYHFYADEDTTFTNEETGEQVNINSDTMSDALPVGGVLTMTDKHTTITVKHISEGDYLLNGHADLYGKPYDEQDALDHIFKWYGATTRHIITRP